jgi:hypothetical protein
MHRVARLVMLAMAACLLGAGPSYAASSAPPAVGCRVFANIPQPDRQAFARPRLVPWGQVQCATPTRLSVEICARRITRQGLIMLSHPIWCSRSSVRIASARTVPLRAGPHGCARGDRYVSYVSIDGLAWDQGPYAICGRAR